MQEHLDLRQVHFLFKLIKTCLGLYCGWEAFEIGIKSVVAVGFLYSSLQYILSCSWFKFVTLKLKIMLKPLKWCTCSTSVFHACATQRSHELEKWFSWVAYEMFRCQICSSGSAQLCLNFHVIWKGYWSFLLRSCPTSFWKGLKWTLFDFVSLSFLCWTIRHLVRTHSTLTGMIATLTPHSFCLYCESPWDNFPDVRFWLILHIRK